MAGCTNRQEVLDLERVIQGENPATFGEVLEIFKNIRPDIEELMGIGPIPYKTWENIPVSLGSQGGLLCDFMVPAFSSLRVNKGHEAGPLVIISHGNRSYKEVHRHHGGQLASYGFQVIIPQLPLTENWSTNGLLIKALKERFKGQRWDLRYSGEDRFTTFVSRKSELNALPNSLKLDVQSVILVGHSFGGSAASMASFVDPSFKGLILLDPAIFSETIEKNLWDIKVPAILLGADPKKYLAKGRRSFYQKYGGAFLELTVNGSTHNDAQSPTMFAMRYRGLDPLVSKKNQEIFKALIVASALSFYLGSDQPTQSVGDDFNIECNDKTKRKSNLSKSKVCQHSGDPLIYLERLVRRMEKKDLIRDIKVRPSLKTALK